MKEEKRIEMVSTQCPGEGYRTHLFADGRYVLSVPGHSCNPDTLTIHRCWSCVEQATILFCGKELKDPCPVGYLAEEYFEVVTNYPGDIELETISRKETK